MKKVSGILLFLLLASTLTLAFNIQSVKTEWTGTVYIRADGSIDPPDAPIVTFDNITYELTGSITSFNSGIIIERDNIIIDGASYSIESPDDYYNGGGIEIRGRFNVTIKNCKIQGSFLFHFYIVNSIHIYMLRNNLAECGVGVYIRNCSNINFSYNFIKVLYGVDAVILSECNDSIFENNIIEGNFGAGFSITSCCNLTFEENTMKGEFYSGFSVYGYPPKLQHYLHKISSSNLINGKPTYYLINVSNLDINPNEYPEIGYLALVNCTKVTVRECTLQRQAVTLAFTNDSSFINCTFSRASLILQYSHTNFLSDNLIVDGNIELWYSFDNVFRRNSITFYEHPVFPAFYVLDVSLEGYINDVDLSNTIDGRPIVYWVNQRKATVPENASLVLLVNCSEIIVQNLYIIGIPHFAAIQLVSCINCSICNNVIKNDYLGVYLRESSSNYIYGNLLESRIGMVLGRFAEGSNNNLIWNNTFKNNMYGLWLIFANDNKIFHNNFIDNYQHVRLSVFNLNNLWDDGYPSGGNYWSDYSGVDCYSGPYQNITGSDGIGDTPYVINENNVDRYPLMGPFGGLTFRGRNVAAYPSSDVCLIFENVTSEGATSVNVTSVGPEPPSGFKLAGNYYDIKTTANYTGTIRLRIVYDDSNMTLEEEMSLRLMQWDEALQKWVDITTSIDVENNVVFGETTHLSIFAIFTVALPVVIAATIDIKPNVLNLGCRGEWVTAYIELPEGYNVVDINVSTLMLNETIPAELRPTAIGDYDNDTIPDLMVKFDRAKVISYILANVNVKELIGKRFITVTLTITGKLYNGTPFQGSDTIRIIMPMPRGLYKVFPI